MAQNPDFTLERGGSDRQGHWADSGNDLPMFIRPFGDGDDGEGKRRKTNKRQTHHSEPLLRRGRRAPGRQHRHWFRRQSGLCATVEVFARWKPHLRLLPRWRRPERDWLEPQGWVRRARRYDDAEKTNAAQSLSKPLLPDAQNAKRLAQWKSALLRRQSSH